MRPRGASGGAALPVDAILPDLCRAIRDRRGAVLVAPTGSGKTTRVPVALLNSGVLSQRGILLLEPRRVAARAAARWLAREMDTEVGERVGYAIRMDRVAGPRTELLVITEGLLTRRLQEDPFLEGIGAVILDEFHERSLHADLGLALLREIRQNAREDLVVVVMSATLAPEPIAAFLDVPILRCDGRAHPVERRYLSAADDRPLEVQVSVAVRQLLKETRGDLLVFLPGASEIARCQRALEDLKADLNVSVLPLHGDLSADLQDAALSRTHSRRVILSTNVGESAVTIDGVTAVVDTGLARVASFDPRLRSELLELKMTSHANAAQRAGRAGRTEPGVAWHLWTKQKDRELDPAEAPEILRSDLSSTLLEVYGWGSDPERFGWFEPPLPVEMIQGVAHLKTLGAVDERGITAVGRRILTLGVPPRLGRLLLLGLELNCARECALAAAILSERELLFSSRAFRETQRRRTEGDSDLQLRMDLLDAGHGRRQDPDLDERVASMILPLAARWCSMLGVRPGRADASLDRFSQALFLAFKDRVARRREPRSDSAVMVGGRGVRLDTQSTVREAPFFLCLTLHGGSDDRSRECRVRMAHGLSLAMFDSFAADALTTEVVAQYDGESGRVVGRSHTRFLDLVVREKDGLPVDGVLAEEILAREIAADLQSFLPDSEDLPRVRVRLACLAEWRPELGIKPWRDEDLVEALLQLLPGCRSRAQVKEKPLHSLLLGMMPEPHRRAFDSDVPEFLELPSGRRVRLRYEVGRPPVLAARVQHLFGLLETPRVASGRIPCLVECLAPNDRPVQITQDLNSFWRKTYAQVRKDLRGRYPKHAWPEIPPGI